MDSPKSKPNGFTTSTASKDADTKVAPSSKDAAIKARIIKHMNTEHAESLSLYLRHYSGLAPAASSSPRLVDLTLASLTIEDSARDRHTVAVQPPMASWSDVRPRVVAMDRDARAGLGLPPLPPSSSSSAEGKGSPRARARAAPLAAVRAYEPPTGAAHLLMVCLVVWFYSTYIALRAGALGPGHWYWEGVMRYFPAGGAEGYRWLNLALGWPVAGVHGLEAALMARRLRALGVRGPLAGGKGSLWGEGLWWKWVGSTLLEGWGAHQRLATVVRRGGGVRDERAEGRKG